MAYNPAYNNSNSTDETTLAYDLRQIYAKIVGQHMIDVSEARKNVDFYRWFKMLEDLHTISKFKFKEQEEDEEGYKEIKLKVISLANKYPNAWFGTSKNKNEIADIELALRELEEYLYEKMNEAGMFGSKYIDDEGL